jgi:hypothetical protein
MKRLFAAVIIILLSSELAAGFDQAGAQPDKSKHRGA